MNNRLIAVELIKIAKNLASSTDQEKFELVRDITLEAEKEIEKIKLDITVLSDKLVKLKEEKDLAKIKEELDLIIKDKYGDTSLLNAALLDLQKELTS